MVLEVAHVTVLPGHEEAFVASLRQAAEEVLPRSAGFVEFHAHGWCVRWRCLVPKNSRNTGLPRNLP